MDERRLLFIGGAYADIPLIQAAQGLHFHVITTGKRPDALGHLYSNAYQREDFSDTQGMLSLARKLDVDAVCSGCNDFCALSAAYVAGEMGLPGHDTFESTQILHHKDQYRRFAAAHGIPTPSACGFSEKHSALEWVKEQPLPLIVKPVDLGSGAGISRINSSEEAEGVLQGAFATSKAGRVVVEEFVEGSRHGFSCMLRGKKVAFSFFDNEHYYLNPYLVSAASTPGLIPPQAQSDLCAQAEAIAHCLDLVDGIFHAQFILRDGQPIIIEICRRPPGDWYTRFVQLATGVNYPDWIVRAQTGMNLDMICHAEPEGFFTRHCIMCNRTGTISGFTFDPRIQPNIREQFMILQPGDRVTDPLTQRLGIVFFEFATMDEMLERTGQMQELVRADLH